MKKTLTRLAAFALMAVMSTGIIAPVQTASVYAEPVVEDVDKPDGEVVEHGMTYTTKTSSSSGSTTSGKTKSSTTTIKAPSANYTGFSKSGNNTYYFDNGNAVIGCSKLIDNKIYVFDDDGRMLKDGLKTVGGKKFWLNKDGTAKTNTWTVTKPKNDKDVVSWNQIYYYSNGAGIVTKYSMKKNKWDNTLLINDRYFTDKDLPAGLKGVLFKWVKVDNYFFELHSYNGEYTIELVHRLGAPTSLSNDVYDLGSGKYIGKIYVSDDYYDATNKLLYKANGATPFKCNDSLVVLDIASSANSNSIDLKFCSYNNSNKTMKYITYDIVFKNAVGDYVKDDISGQYHSYYHSTGPIKPCEIDRGTVDYGFWTKSKVYPDVASIQIEYMDGTKETIYPSYI